MTQVELSLLFPPRCILNDQVLLVPPADFYKLGGMLIDHSRAFLIVDNGSLDISINGEAFRMEGFSFLDLLDTATLEFGSVNTGVNAWLLLTTFKFASGSLKNLRPGPQKYMVERMNRPICMFTEQEGRKIVQQLDMLKDTLANITHYYRQELAEIYFRSFNLEIGNALFTHLSDKFSDSKYISKSDFVMLDFLKLVSEHFAIQHHVDFYADMLCITPKHLSRIIKEKMGKTAYCIICDEMIHHALVWLEDDKVSVGQIAERLHFSDQAAFCKFFKKQMKMSPMAYRRKKNVE